MSLFRIDPDNPFSGPHQNQPVKTAGPAPENADLAMLLVHGRGASAESMLMFAEEFGKDTVHYRAVQASGHTWYPNSFLAPKEQNQPGINSGLQAIHDQIQTLNDLAIPTEKIILLGFSQGACLSSEFAARHPQHFGGIVAFSGGLIGDEINPENYEGSFENTPVFMGCSDRDPHIPQERVDETARVFRQLGAEVDKRIYKGMGHTVNRDEIESVQKMITSLK